ncbi:MAG: hypothetical protein Q4E57_02005 [Eubacteriales bacterium]|nr:hypothetical protein [Eubacteriales bacterium]
MGMLQKEKNRNAAKARNSFVTRKVENKLDVLAGEIKKHAGECCTSIEKSTLTRSMSFKGFQYFNNLKLVYNWENRFMSVNYNLQMISEFLPNDKYEETGSCVFELAFKMKGKPSWVCKSWNDSDVVKKDEYIKRLSNPLIMDRVKALDIVDLEITHYGITGSFVVSCESMIGSTTWILIPPITSLITPKESESVKFFELFELLGDALINNK